MEGGTWSIPRLRQIQKKKTRQPRSSISLIPNKSKRSWQFVSEYETDSPSKRSCTEVLKARRKVVVFQTVSWTRNRIEDYFVETWRISFQIQRQAIEHGLYCDQYQVQTTTNSWVLVLVGLNSSLLIFRACIVRAVKKVGSPRRTTTINIYDVASTEAKSKTLTCKE